MVIRNIGLVKNNQILDKYPIKSIEYYIAGLLIGTMLIGLCIDKFISPEYFSDPFVVEDGLIEYISAFVLLTCSFILFRYIFRAKNRPWTWYLVPIAMALLLFFAFGEELSWGQRIFNWESGDTFKEMNKQHETNLHNLVIGGVDLNKVVFSQLLTIGLAIYILILPFLARKFESIHNLCNQFGVPVFRNHHILLFLVATMVVLIITSMKKWELYEYAFGLIFLMLYINPWNTEVYPLKK